MQLHEMLGRKRFGPFEDAAGALVAAAHGALFFVRQRQDAQREDLVDLGAVEKVARTLRRDLRIVVENDGRREHGVALALLRRRAPARYPRSGRRPRPPETAAAVRAARRTRRRARAGWCAPTAAIGRARLPGRRAARRRTASGSRCEHAMRNSPSCGWSRLVSIQHSSGSCVRTISPPIPIVAHGFDGSGGRKRESAAHGPGCQFREMNIRQAHLALGRLLPRFVGGRDFDGGRGTKSGRARHEHAINEPQTSTFTASVVSGPPSARHCGLHLARLDASSDLAISARIDDAEIPPLPVLHRRRAVRIEKIALVEDGIRDLLHQSGCSRFHRLLARREHSFERRFPSRNSVADLVLM